MPAAKSENGKNDQFEFLFGKPPLLEGEDEERYKRAATALIGGGLPKALDCYLSEICDVDYAEDLSDKYFNGDAKGRKEVMAVLAEHGITMAQLHAKAAQLESGGLAMFDRLVAARENGRRLLRKEAERRSPRQDHDPDDITEQ